MSDKLTRYRIDPYSLAEIEKARNDWRVAKVVPHHVEPDNTLQQIADAPRCKHGRIDVHQPTVLYASYWCQGAPELRALLDALLEGNGDE